MNHQQRIRGVRGASTLWTVLLTTLLLGLAVTPAAAAGKTTQHTLQRRDTTTLNATFYLSTPTLRSLFQSTLDQQIPRAVNSAIAGIVGKMPPQDQAWVSQMANTLIQPSATLVSLYPQRGGLATTIRMSLYPGDPKPITASLLVGFTVANASTVQVNAYPLNGSPALVSGPLRTFQVPVGQLNSIKAMPNCGDSALAVNVHFPVSLAPLPGPTPVTQGGFNAARVSYSPTTKRGLISRATARVAPTIRRIGLRSRSMVGAGLALALNSYIEIPATSLAAIGSALGSWQINDSLTAENIQFGTQGSNMVISADIYLGPSFRLARATTTLAPSASGGNLVAHVLGTQVTIFEIFTFPYDVYNQQIEQILNSILSGIFAGKFSVTDAAVGPNGHVPCAAGDSLLLTGTANIG